MYYVDTIAVKSVLLLTHTHKPCTVPQCMIYCDFFLNISDSIVSETDFKLFNCQAFYWPNEIYRILLEVIAYSRQAVQGNFVFKRIVKLLIPQRYKYTD